MKSQVELKLQGSSGSVYSVVIERVGDKVRMSCDCKAGLTDMLCKHRLWVLGGFYELVLPDSEKALSSAVELVKGSTLETKYSEYLGYKDQKEKADKQLSIAKRMLAKSMVEGT